MVKNYLSAFVIALLLATTCGDLQANENGQYAQLPAIALSALSEADCKPIEGFYERPEVYLSSYFFLESTSRGSLLAVACDIGRKPEQYKIVIAAPTYAPPELGSNLTKVPSQLECPREIILDQMPYGVELVVKNYNPNENYAVEHLFGNIDLESPKSFLAIRNLRMWGIGEEYVCIGGEWRTSVIH